MTPCAFWPSEPYEPPVQITGRGPANVLILQNLRDPATPLAGARQLRKAFGDRARMVTADPGGHLRSGQHRQERQRMSAERVQDPHPHQGLGRLRQRFQHSSPMHTRRRCMFAHATDKPLLTWPFAVIPDRAQGPHGRQRPRSAAHQQNSVHLDGGRAVEVGLHDGHTQLRQLVDQPMLGLHRHHVRLQDLPEQHRQPFPELINCETTSVFLRWLSVDMAAGPGLDCWDLWFFRN
ncbi:alpha/beta hydrolase [Nonomuraea sp. NPDC052129]|uniref:alpha/beta hydrolase n=1 Tax=Nonomuraea sp. NPDC052129 TaxID=3154651 RepID=UPI003438A63C